MLPYINHKYKSGIIRNKCLLNHQLCYTLHKIFVLVVPKCCLQCFDTVGWASGRASGL